MYDSGSLDGDRKGIIDNDINTGCNAHGDDECPLCFGFISTADLAEMAAQNEARKAQAEAEQRIFAEQADAAFGGVDFEF